jgi:hypothetical protein
MIKSKKTFPTQHNTTPHQEGTIKKIIKAIFQWVFLVNIKAMFVSRNSLFGKPLSKLSCVCLPLGKLVNEKHFQVKEKFGLVSRKMFSLLAVFVFRKVVSEKSLSKLSCICLLLEKLVSGKHFPVKGKFNLVLRKLKN